MTNSADPDQLASEEANWSGSTLFAKTGHVVLSKRRVMKKQKESKENFAEILMWLYILELRMCNEYALEQPQWVCIGTASMSTVTWIHEK